MDKLLEIEELLFGIIEDKHDPNKLHPASIKNITQFFKLPISYLTKDIFNLDAGIIEELELIQLKPDTSLLDKTTVESTSHADKTVELANHIGGLYSNVFNPQTTFGEIINDEWCKTYTSDKNSLKILSAY